MLAAARQRSAEMGVEPVTPGTGALLHFLATVLQARAVVEVGTGTGVSGIWLLRGMTPEGILTSIDVEGEHQRLARESFTEAGLAAGRCRLIAGRALEVMPRLADGGYDLVFCDGDRAEYADYLGEALRLLRPGGVVVFDQALLGDRVADSSARDPKTVAMRELGRTVRDDEHLQAVLLPVGSGVLAAVKK